MRIRRDGSGVPVEHSSAALDAVAVALRQLRVLAAALLFLQYAAQPYDGGVPPVLIGTVLASAMLGVNLLSVIARRGRPWVASALGAAELAADAALVFLVVSVLKVAREDLVWVALVVPVLEGALRYRLRGAVVTWAALGLAYFFAELFLLGGAWTPATEGSFLTQVGTTIHRLAVVLLVAIPAGYLSEQLLVDIDTQRRATEDAVRRSGLLQKVAEAGERVTQLDERILDAVLDCATALGFDAAEVCELDDGGGWRTLARRGRSPLPPPDELPDATQLAVERRATVIVDPAGASPQEQRVLRAAELTAAITSPLVRGDGGTILLRVGLRDRAPLAPQVECLELLAGQAATALRNGVLVDELRDMQGRLEHQAFHDALTSLANRARFLLRLEEALAQARSEGIPLAVLYLDLDRFKPVNDSLGHEVGNELLQAVAGRLLTCVREGDVVARLGGDEFAILMADAGESESELVAERVVEALETPFAPAGHEVVISTSVGIAQVLGEDLSATELVRRADVAMYDVKKGGRGRWAHYAAEFDAAARERVWLENDLRHALERGELKLHYQAMVTVRTREIAGFEALLRWHHPRKGTQRPDTFIPVAEDSGLIVEIGRWVLMESCAQLKRLQTEFSSAPPLVSVNVSPRQLQHPGFFDDLDELITHSGVDPSGLLLEITERIVAVDGCEEILERLRGRGVRLALDDFGQGQTSLRYLRRFPLDVLKVDSSFVHGASSDPRDRVILAAIVRLASQLGLSVVAEGVETAAHFELLEELDCELAQGFYLHHPEDAASAVELLRGGPGIRPLSPSLRAG